MSEVWTEWQGEIVNGTYPLRRSLGTSNHGAVYLTQNENKGIADAAIKLVPADPLLTDAQLSRWQTAAALSHPRVIAVLDFGTCLLQGRSFLFLVTEYAEQTLAQILPQRALTDDELREMLPATLEGVAFLHGKGLAHGALKPSNILVVNDQLKLSCDTVHAGESDADDIEALGMTMVEALTQHRPAGLDEQSENALLAANISPEILGLIRQCLSRDPGSRPTVDALRKQLGLIPQTAPPEPSPSPVTPETVKPPRFDSRSPPSTRNFWIAAISSLIIAAGWGGVHWSRSFREARHDSSRSPVSSPSTPDSASPSPQPLGPQTSGAPPPQSVSVLHAEIPKASQRALESIHGHIRIGVQVTVDRAGKVVNATLMDAGPSRYFARLAAAAARKWKFAPPADPRARISLKFEFTREGATAGVAT